MLKRIILSALVLMLLASPAWALKKVLLFVPGNEYSGTGWMRMAICGLIVTGGGSYECIYMNADTTCTDSVKCTLPVGTHKQVGNGLAYRLWHARNSGKYGLAIFIAASATDICYNARPSHGNGTFARYCSIDQSPLGIPTLLAVRLRLGRVTAYTAKLYSGCTDANYWAYGTSADASDSLWAITSKGDSILWQKTCNSDRRHLLSIGSAPESSYPWTVDIWTKHGVGAAARVAPGNGASIYMWHVHRTAYDAAQLPGAGQDSVIYYIHDLGHAYWATCWDSELKSVAVLLKKYNCIKDIPVSVTISDYGAAFTKQDSSKTTNLMWAATDSFLQYCSDRNLYVDGHCEYSQAGLAVTDTLRLLHSLQKWYSNPYVRFHRHTGGLYTDAAKSSSYGIFGTWGDGGAAEASTPLLRDLRRDYYLMGATGLLQYMKDADTWCPGGGNYAGVAGYGKQDTIWSAMAAVGVRKILVLAGPRAYTSDGYNIYHNNTYPVNMTWTGGTGTIGITAIVYNFSVLSPTLASDSLYASPSLLTDSLIVNATALSGLSALYSTFPWVILNSGRLKDISGAWASEPTDYPTQFNLESRGMIFACHQTNFITRNGTVHYNTPLLWLKHVWNNLRAYNHLAQDDDPTTGNLFNPTNLTAVDQKVGPK